MVHIEPIPDDAGFVYNVVCPDCGGAVQRGWIQQRPVGQQDGPPEDVYAWSCAGCGKRPVGWQIGLDGQDGAWAWEGTDDAAG